MRSLIREGKVRAVHDVSDGGLLVAVAEMALAGGIGVQLFPYEGRLPAHAAWFGEDQGRYVLEAEPGPRRGDHRAGAPAGAAGARGRPRRRRCADAQGEPALTLDDLRTAHEGWLPSRYGSIATRK